LFKRVPLNKYKTSANARKIVGKKIIEPLSISLDEIQKRFNEIKLEGYLIKSKTF